MKKVIGGAYLVKDDFGKHLKKGFAVILRDYNSLAKVATIEFEGAKFWIDPNYLEEIDGDAPVEAEDEWREKARKPAHYDTGVDTIAFLRANCPPEQVEGFLRGNAIKYLQRYDKKNGVDDLRKAKDYVEMLIEELEGRE